MEIDRTPWYGEGILVKKRPPYNVTGAIRGALRRAFSRSPMVREVLLKTRREVPKYRKDGTRAKKDAVQYQCNVCKKYVGSTHVSVDHIIPVVPETGFTDWKDFIERLFCGPENLQCICSSCHDLKTKKERQARRKLQYERQIADLMAKPNLEAEDLKLMFKLQKKLAKLK